MEKYIVDVLVPTARRGGPENIINMLAEYLLDKDICFRVVQFVYGGEKWTVPEIEFYHLYPDGMDQTNDTFIEGYRDFLRKHIKPDAILAVSWPFLCYSAQMSKEGMDLNIPVISWLHASVEKNEEHGFGGMDALGYADIHLAISDNIVSDIKRGLPDAIVYRVYNPIKSVKEISPEQDLLKLVFIGRLVEIKRVDVILRAIDMTELPWKLYIYGDGQERGRLEKMTEEMGLSDRVRFMGWCDDPWYTAADASFLIIASDYDSFSLAAMEALSHGIPIISTPCAGILEYLRDGENGYTFTFHDPVALCEVLDGVGRGDLAYPDRKVCMETARPYLSENAIEDFYIKLIATINGKIIADMRV